MRVVVAGGHGQIALIVQRLLASAGHQPVGLVRNPAHVADLEAVGSTGVVADLEHTDADELARHLAGADAVVFAAGGGPDSGVERKITVDRDAAVLLADAAEQAGVSRYVMVSAMAADDYDPESDEVFQVYLRAKSQADADLRVRGLAWTIVRPGGLTDDPPTGRVHLAESTGRGTVSRADVASLVVELLVTGRGVHRQFEVVTADRAIGDAVAGLSD